MQPKHTYKQLITQLNQLTDTQTQYQTILEDTIQEISKILETHPNTIQLEITPTHQHKPTYKHELTIRNTHTLTTIKQSTLQKLTEYLQVKDLEIQPHRDQIIITYITPKQPNTKQPPHRNPEPYNNYVEYPEEDNPLL